MYKQNTYKTFRIKKAMNKNGLNKTDIHVFLISFLILVILFAAVTYTTANSQIKSNYEVIEKSTLSIANSYSKELINAQAATDFITELLEEKLISVSHTILFAEDNESNQRLMELADKFKVDQINLLNEHGEILYSNIEEYVGWKAYEDHPIHDFMVSNQESFIEDIRKDTENELFYKFAYIRQQDNSFIQVGMLVENIYRFLEKFQIQQLIDDISRRGDIENTFFYRHKFSGDC